jgi:hypothetical protein
MSGRAGATVEEVGAQPFALRLAAGSRGRSHQEGCHPRREISLRTGPVK